MNAERETAAMRRTHSNSDGAGGPAVIEWGIIIAGPLDPVDRRAVEAATCDVARSLQGCLPEFEWRLRQVRRDEWNSNARAEPTDLLQQAREERDERGWDVAFVLTAADLVSHYKPFALAVISRSLDVAVVSTARIDPRATAPDTPDAERASAIRTCVVRLILHAFGHWAGLTHDETSGNAMNDIGSVEMLKTGSSFHQDQCETMKLALTDIADQRLEERDSIRGVGLTRFYILAAWENRGEILDAVIQAKPWEFPLRLGRLTTAAVSTVLVLLMTAETWDMAMSQGWKAVLCLFGLALVATTAYVAVRQQLLLRRNGRKITEQIVTSNVAAAAIVGSGMLVMFVLLCFLAFVAGTLLFPAEVVTGWAASVSQPMSWRHHLLLSATVASLGIVIGALGASFEPQHHFRHVVFVDEEV